MSTLPELVMEVTQRLHKEVDRTLDSHAFDVDGTFNEIIEDVIPHGNRLLMKLAATDLFLATRNVDGKVTPTPVTLVYDNLYDFLLGILQKEFDSLGRLCPSCYGEGVLHADGVPSIGCRKCWGSGEIKDD